MDTSEPPAVSRFVGAATISLFGVLLSGVHGYHVLVEVAPPLAQLLIGVAPMSLGVTLVVAGPLLYRSRLDAAAITTTLAWGLIGGLALCCISILIVAHQILLGVPIHDPGYVISAAVTGGAIVGTIAGRYDGLNRQKATLISSLQAATSALSEETTTEEVSQCAVEIANDVLDIPLTGIWLYDDEQSALVPEAIAEPAQEAFDSPPTYPSNGSRSWAVFESGNTRRYDDSTTSESDGEQSQEIIRSEIIVPLGDVGVMKFGSTEKGRFDSLDETVAALLGTATEGSLVRADREEALRTQRELLQQQNERLEEFTSVVSHDLRNPLSVAQGRIELARQDDSEEHLDEASTALDDMGSLIEDLLELAKQGHTTGDTERISLSSIAEDAWRNIDPRDATIQVESIEFEADVDRLRQLLENLFVNAVVHAGTDTTIRVGPLADESGFFVADDGPGIGPDERTRLFDVGYTDHEDGTGFGLSIVRRIADAHGWSIRVTDSDSGGARFEFQFE